jgi:TonB family protein
MREIINYLLEANLALLLFLVSYKLLLRRETNFRFMRFFMLTAIVVSVVFPLIHLNNNESTALPSVSDVVPSNWLPEIVISANHEAPITQSTNAAYNFWQVAAWIYGTGTALFLAWLVFQLFHVFETIRHASAYQLEKFKIIESTDDRPTFSFFHLIYIGRAHELTANEKEQIIRHEAVHARQLHSLDILLVTLLKIVFWFNPFINVYKKILIQLHEFEADARAVEDSDVNKYCSLLARVALQSAHFHIASHFNQSLTLKRIEMMRTIKKKIRPWKIAALAAIIPVSFFIVACQDQVNEMAKSTVSQTGDYPPVVKAEMDEYMKKHPEAKLTYMDGIPEEVDKFITSTAMQDKIVNTYKIDKDGVVKKGVLLSNITQYAENLKTDHKIFMVVERQPEYVGGYDALREFISQHLVYPKDALMKGLEGTVYVSTVVNTDGSLSDFTALRSVDPLLDVEALRVVKSLPAWIPGKQNGRAVRTRFILPIKFNMNANTNPIPASGISPVNGKMEVTLSKATTKNGKTILEGTISSENEGLPGANIVIKGTTSGTTTDSQGKFKLVTPQSNGELVFSFIGFESETKNF